MNHDALPRTDGVATPNTGHAADAAPPEQPLRQIQQRLLNLVLQVERMQTRLESLADESETSSDQLRAILQHLTNTQAAQALNERLAELATQRATEQEQLAALAQDVEKLARYDQLERLFDSMAGREQLAALTQSVEQLARHDQIDRLLELVAERNQLASLEETIRKLSRTQFKSNTLGETREQQITNALATLQEIATRREQQRESQTLRASQELTDARSEGRSLMAAELLPALDSLELVLENGQQLLARQRSQIEAALSAQQAYLTALSDALTQGPAPESPERGFWQRLWGTYAPLPAAPNPLPEVPTERVDEAFLNINQATTAWLQGLSLVRDRFVSLLAGEGIQPIDALHQPFDPHLHVAVETEVRTDVPPDTVVHVARQGYRQHNRILRYAEVVVARPPTTITNLPEGSL